MIFHARLTVGHARKTKLLQLISQEMDANFTISRRAKASIKIDAVGGVYENAKRRVAEAGET